MITTRFLIAIVALLLALPAFPQWDPPAVTRTTGILPKDLGLIVNTDDPWSEDLLDYYTFLHGVPGANVVRVALGSSEMISRDRFEQANAIVKQKMPANVQALGLLFRAPSKVEASNSITSAFARGFIPRTAGQGTWALGYQNPYDWRQDHSQPYTRHRIRPAMMIAAETLGGTYRLMERGRWAEGTNPANAGVVMRTSDFLRSIRTRYLLPAQVINGVSLTIRDGEAYPLAGPVMFYFQGRATIPDLPLRKFRPGAWTDTLTSCAGMVNGCGGQVTVWQIIDAGATGSYGTVEEPYVSPSKFPAPDTFVRIYTGGATLIEAAWRSVGNPYQGLFVGDPLAAPYAKGK